MSKYAPRLGRKRSRKSFVLDPRVITELKIAAETGEESETAIIERALRRELDMKEEPELMEER